MFLSVRKHSQSLMCNEILNLSYHNLEYFMKHEIIYLVYLSCRHKLSNKLYVNVRTEKYIREIQGQINITYC